MAEVRATVGSYRLEDVLGRGGMGVVYRATALGLDRPVALKLIAPEFAADPEYRARFRREARLAASLDHPHVIPIYEADESNGVLFIAMQFVDGVDLHKLIAREGRLDPKRATRIVCQLAWALDSAHAHGLVHRDVKPHNVLVTGPLGREHAYLTDFGLARQRSATTALSTPGHVLGTLAYLAPEQLMGAGADARSDVYSLGCLLYESLTGRPAYELADEGAAIAAKLAGPPPSVLALVSTAPPEIDTILGRALAREPERRFASAGELSAALLATSAGEPSPVAREQPTRSSRGAPARERSRVGRAAPGASDARLLSRPLSLTPLIGRENELGELTALLAPGRERLLTLTGPGGTGKTRLALELAAVLSADFADGVWLVPLAAVARPEALPAAIARTLELAPGGNAPLRQALEHALRARELLLVLDNFEHLLPAASFISELVARCPALSVLSTSRAPLRISGERVYGVAPLAVPVVGAETPTELARSAAVALFVARAQAATPTFEPTAEALADVAGICRRLGGLPLAIELAAARTPLLSPAELLARLTHSLELLTGGARDLPARQRTLRATLDWSYRLLAPREQELFAHLATFSGGCTLADAEAVCGAGVDELATLLDMSLLQRWWARSGGPRLLMLDTVGEYARELLERSGERARLARAHAEHYCGLAERLDAELQGPEPLAGLDRLDAEHDNLIAALGWCRESEERELGLRLACALASFWRIRGRAREGRRWLTELLEGAERAPSALRARAHYEAGWLALNQGDYEGGLPQLDDALELFRTLGDAAGQARSLAEISFAHAELGRPARARRLAAQARRLARGTGEARTIASALAAGARASEDPREATALAEEALGLYRGLGDTFWTAALLNNLGYLAVIDGDPDRALALLEESADLARELRDDPGLGTALGNVGLAALLKGDRARAARALGDALVVCDELGYRASLSEYLLALGALSALEGELREAARLAGVAERLRVSPTSAAEQLLEERYLGAARAELGEGEWSAAWEEGKAMAPDDALVLAGRRASALGADAGANPEGARHPADTPHPGP